MRWLIFWSLFSGIALTSAGIAGTFEYRQALDQSKDRYGTVPEEVGGAIPASTEPAAEAPLPATVAPTAKNTTKKSTTPTANSATSSTSSTAETPAATDTAAPVAPSPWRVVAIGDIADCTKITDDEVATLVKSYQSNILILGDNAYPDGSATDFSNCFVPIYGDAKARSYPTPGNHEYRTAGAAGYYGYWGSQAGDPAKGYYSFSNAGWHIVALNTECSYIGGCASGSTMLNWLQADLASNTATCTVMFTHHPRFSSGQHGSDATLNDLWLALQAGGVDLYLAGHDHTYERFAPSGGLTEFVVGTGGSSLYNFPTIETGSVFRYNSSGGALVLDLYPTYYSWQYVTSTDRTVKDSGTANCS